MNNRGGLEVESQDEAPNDLIVYYHNAGGARTKLKELCSAIACCAYDVIMLTETWFSSDIKDSEFCPSCYDVFRLDRNPLNSTKERGGGVTIVLRKELHAQLLTIPFDSLEQLYVAVKLNSQYIILGCVYIPPSSNAVLYQTHGMTIDYIFEVYPESKLILAGDYNLPNIEWGNDGMGLTAKYPDNSPAVDLINCLSFHNMYQCNNLLNSRSVTLDLVLSNLSTVVVGSPIEEILPDSIHHRAISFNIPLCSSIKPSNYEEYYFDFKNGNYILMNDLISRVDWRCLESLSPDESIGHFYDVLYSALNVCVPLKRYKTSSFPGWFSAELRSLIIEKKRAHKRFKESNRVTDYALFCRLRAECKKLNNSCYRSYIDRIENNITSNPRSFWVYINNRRNNYSLPINVNYNNVTSQDNTELVNLFADFFSTVYKQDTVTAVPSFTFDKKVHIDTYVLSGGDIIDAIDSIPWKFSSGPDGIPGFLLKKCVFTLAVPLLSLFNRSLLLGMFPGYWKFSFLKPIHKSGPKEQVENYRAISTQSEIPKLLDHLVTSRLSWDCRHFMNVEQHGFRSARSTTSNLLIYENYILNSLEAGLQVDSVYMDFSKAFDRVNHVLLLAKLEAIGIGDPLLSWFKSFLSGRTLAVKHGNALSRLIQVPSGVPQGSHCGPVLFNIFVSDVSNFVTSGSSFLSFADDLKMFRAIRSSADPLLLQEDLNGFSRWCITNMMDLNIKKCFKISFYRLTSPVEFPYEIGGLNLQVEKSVRDLGVELDNKMAFSNHIYNIINKSLKMLGFIYRSSEDFSVATMRLLYCALVRPILEYASVIWTPHYRVHVDSLERVQNKFLRMIAFKMGLERDEYSYTEVRSFLGLDTLERRRLFSDLCLLFKLINGGIDCPELLSMVCLWVPERRGRNTDVFSVSFHRTNYGQNNPITRVLRYGNEFSGNLNFFGGSLSQFKVSLKKL